MFYLKWRKIFLSLEYHDSSKSFLLLNNQKRNNNNYASEYMHFQLISIGWEKITTDTKVQHYFEVHLSETEFKNVRMQHLNFSMLYYEFIWFFMLRTKRSKNEYFYKTYAIATSWNIFWKSIRFCRNDYQNITCAEFTSDN